MNPCAWFDGNAVAFDLETTGPDPLTAVPVSAFLARITPTGLDPSSCRAWLINPGVPIPAEATAIHGITNEQAAKGQPLVSAMTEIVAMLPSPKVLGWVPPLIAMNAAFDLTVIDRRWRLTGQQFDAPRIVLDPWAIDLAMDRRRQGKRRLADLCAHYGVKQEGAHSSQGDALAAARLVWKQSQRWWALSKHTPEEMMKLQRETMRAYDEDLAQWAKGKGLTDWKRKPPGWPVYERSADEGWEER